jgi:DNA-binding transcriptional LysR family regulator
MCLGSFDKSHRLFFYFTLVLFIYMLDALRHLSLIVQHGTFTAAARTAHLSQPALSASIARLEEQLGAALLDRGRHGARLTAAGEALLPHARAALAAVDDGRNAVAEVVGLRRGQVAIGAGATVATYLLPGHLAAFRKAYPAVTIAVRELPSALIGDALERGDIDLAIVDASAVVGRRLEAERWHDDEMVLVGADASAQARDPFVTFIRGSTTRDLLERHFPRAEVVVELSGIAAIKQHVRAAIGIALLTRIAVAPDLAEGTLVEIAHRATPIPRRFVLAHRGIDRLSPSAERLRKLLLSSARNRSRDGRGLR